MMGKEKTTKGKTTEKKVESIPPTEEAIEESRRLQAKYLRLKDRESDKAQAAWKEWMAFQAENNIAEEIEDDETVEIDFSTPPAEITEEEEE